METIRDGSLFRLNRAWTAGIATVIFSGLSFLCFGGYMGMGITAGDVIGLPGRESDVANYQRIGGQWFMGSLLCQTAVIALLTSMMKFESDAKPAPRFLARLVAATIVSFPLTVFVGAAIAAIFTVVSRF